MTTNYNNYQSIRVKNDYVEDEPVVDNAASKKQICITSIISCTFALLYIGVIFAFISTNPLIQSDSAISFASDETSLSFTLNREGYPVLDHFKSQSRLKYSILANYGAIIEPYANMTLYVDNQNMYNTYNYAVCESENIESCQTGQLGSTVNTAVNFACKPYDTYIIIVDETYSVDALCMYVRRDIESLTSDDLEQTMDAMYAVWSTTDEDGQLQYGSNFHSATYFMEAHHFNAGGRVADHIHEGLGFVTQHIKLSNLFEKSIQSVNPMVALPYWEFTRESSSNISIYDSIMFSKKTFGSLREPVDATWGFTYKNDVLSDGSIKNGRWKKAKTELNTRFDSIQNGYGLLRSPWNMNPSPYITRFASSSSALPTCSDYYTLFGSSSTIDFLDEIQKGAHAPIHAALGGTFGCDILDAISSQLSSTTDQLRLCHMWSFYMKDLYRAQFLEPQTGCSNDAFDDSPNELSCSYVCNNSTKTDVDFVETLKDKMGGQGYFVDGVDWTSIRDFICDGDAHKMVVGAHSDSSSASDPSFWPVHPTQERLLHAYMIASADNNTWTWPDNSLTDYVCGTTRCILSGQTEKNYDSECCYGHYEYDQFLDYENADEYGHIGQTNHEVLLTTNPYANDYSMPYVYDGFSWSHCSTTLSDVDSFIMRLYHNIHL